MFYAPYATDKDIGSPPPTAGMPHLIRAARPDAVIIVVPALSYPRRKQVISFAKLNLMLSSDCSQIGTGSSNSPRSATQFSMFAILLERCAKPRRVRGFLAAEGYRRAVCHAAKSFARTPLALRIDAYLRSEG